MTIYAALGDSITVGMGDPAPGGGWRGWAALLAATLDQPDLRNLATLGALACDVERFQLPAALAVKPGVPPVPGSGACAGGSGREGMGRRRPRSVRRSGIDRPVRRRLGSRRARGWCGDPSTGGRSRRGS